mmetsp:Transcript_15422/g.18780  ORF Transcript_15422/g.18780 Transcript_15422/m.18780 type:complete len:113 (+) Transcript_15422:1141-1479(+)
MTYSIMKQLERYHNGDPVGIPDLDKLKTWDQACQDLCSEYDESSKLLFLPLWYMVTFLAAIAIMYLACVRTLCGGSVRFYFHTAKDRSERKVKESLKILKQRINNKVETVLV